MVPFHDPPSFKVLVIGNWQVGKNSLIDRLGGKIYQNPTKTNFGPDVPIKKIVVYRQHIKFHIFNTPVGQQRLKHSMLPQYYRCIQGIIFIYDVSNPESYFDIAHWMQEAADNTSRYTIRMLIGMKCDLPRKITTEHAKSYAELLNMHFYETSTKLDNQDLMYRTLRFDLAQKLQENESKYKFHDCFGNAVLLPLPLWCYPSQPPPKKKKSGCFNLL